MNYWLAKLIMAAGDGDGSWMQILFLIVIMVFSLVGRLVKAKTNKDTPKKQNKQVPRKPLRKPTGGGTDTGSIKQKPWHAERPKPASGGQPRPAVVKSPVRPPGRKIIRPRPQPVTKQKIADGVKRPAGLADFDAEPKLGKVSGLKVEITESKEMPQTEYLSEILSDYKDSERLRRAILHYEILGKPVSLREQSEQISGF